MKKVAGRVILFYSLLIVTLLNESCKSCNNGAGGTVVSQDTLINGDTIPKVLLHPNDIDSTILSKYFQMNLPNDSISKNLRVGPGETIYVNASEKAFAGLVMDNNSTMVISNKLSHCNLVLTTATFGNNVKIKCEGDLGIKGDDGIPYTSQAIGGKNGDKGYPGKDGTNGGNAVNLKITAGFIKYGNGIQVISKGGNGGAGGRGNNGQKGAHANCAQRGGDGGIGGAGGKGGNAGYNGNITMTFYYETGTNPNPGTIELKEDIATGGSGGQGGPGGSGGEEKSCGLFGEIHQPSGHDGPRGNDGIKGDDGKKGTNTLTGPHFALVKQ